jgi:hypothetical protein
MQAIAHLRTNGEAAALRRMAKESLLKIEQTALSAFQTSLLEPERQVESAGLRAGQQGK